MTAIHKGFEVALKKDEKRNALLTPWVDLYGVIQRILGKDSFPGTPLLRLKNGYLAWEWGSSFLETTDICIQRVHSFKKFLDSYNIPLLYVQAPDKIHPVDSQLPRGCTDYTNRKADLFLEGLHENAVDYWDVRQIYRENPKNHYQNFYKGDHHWHPQYMLEANLRLCNWLTQKYGFQFPSDWLNRENYRQIMIEKNWTGSQKRQAGKYYPAWEEDHLKIISLSPPWPTNLQNPRVLLITDSFGSPFFRFLASCGYPTEHVDIRARDTLCTEKVKDWKPDLVIIYYTPSSIESFMFSLESYDDLVGTSY